MRFLLALGGLMCAGCVGPHTSGALWSQQNLAQEITLSRVTDATRTAHVKSYEQSMAVPLLAAERARVADQVDACPGRTRQPLAISEGDLVRDRIRVLGHAETGLQTSVAALAQADWFARRGQATGEALACARARAALDGQAQATPVAATSPSAVSSPTDAAAARTLLDALGPATVSRDGSLSSTPADPAESRLTTISAYALQASDTVTAPSPLPQYLARVYGGTLTRPAAAPNLGGRTPEAIVDDLAPIVPDWEPDALLAALSTSAAQ